MQGKGTMMLDMAIIPYIGYQKHSKQRKNYINQTLSKLKTFTSKCTIKKVKAHPIQWEEIFANHTYDNGFYLEHSKKSCNSTIIIIIILKNQIAQLKNG